MKTERHKKFQSSDNYAHAGSSKDREKWSDSGHILKVKPKIYGVDVREREVRDSLKIQGLSILKKRGRLWGTQAWDIGTRSLSVDMLSLRCLVDTRAEVLGT